MIRSGHIYMDDEEAKRHETKFLLASLYHINDNFYYCRRTKALIKDNRHYHININDAFLNREKVIVEQWIIICEFIDGKVSYSTPLFFNQFYPLTTGKVRVMDLRKSNFDNGFTLEIKIGWEHKEDYLEWVLKQ